MDDDNPYAPPRSTDPPLTPAVPSRTGVWRQGPCLVVGREARLPDVCLVTNLPAEIRWPTKVKVLFPSRLAGALIFCPPVGLLLYAIFALEGTPVTIPLRRAVLARRMFHRRQTMAMVVVGIMLCAAALLRLSLDPVVNTWLVVVGWVLILVAAIYDSVTTTLFTVERLTADHTWINGACDAYLRRLEEYPGS